MLGHPEGNQHGNLLSDQRQQPSTGEGSGSSRSSLRKGQGQMQSYAGAVHRDEQGQTQRNNAERRSGRQHGGGLRRKSRKVVPPPLRHGRIEQVRRHDHDAREEGSCGRSEEASMGLKHSGKNDTDAVQRDLWREDHEHGGHEIR